ncbi:hypothetical protein GIB67_043091 [Kingdonia uniflora]|uniref:Ubiquinol oxidase n=1 Tax=Kingdonia uniflora TaxID=39325 RepID=A0A7J7PCD5_9MAGN|nr:hypothetical protein GIB67_043091 [Kingdonia uniflora]
MMLETMAAVPGMVEGMLLHLRSLWKFEPSSGWIKALLEEAENERMHLMTMADLVKPNAHRVAVHSYTEFLKDIESGAIKNIPAPAIAIDYWKLPKDVTFKDVVTVIRADETRSNDNTYKSPSL